METLCTMFTSRVQSSDLDAYKRAHLRATAVARALYAALHVVVIGTLFACDSHLSHAWAQRHWLYAICFVGLNTCCMAMFVALSVMDPGFLQPNQRVWGACKPEPKQVQESGLRPTVRPHPTIFSSAGRKQEAFDYARLLAKGRGKPNAHSDAPDGVVRSPGIAPAHAAKLLSAVSPGLLDGVCEAQIGSPTSMLLQYLPADSRLSCLPAIPENAAEHGDEGGSAVGSWADVLPVNGQQEHGPRHAAVNGGHSAPGGATAAEEDFVISAVRGGWNGREPSAPRDPAWYEKPSPGRWCEWCAAWQRLRAAHCHACDRCVDTHDHHCPWLGTCIGARNRPLFLAFLLAQTAALTWALCETASMLAPSSALPSAQAAYLFGFDLRVLALCAVLAALLALLLQFLTYQLYLVATAQTAQEHAQRMQVPYLMHVPTGKHPFSQGLWANLCMVFRRNVNWELPMHCALPR